MKKGILFGLAISTLLVTSCNNDATEDVQDVNQQQTGFGLAFDVEKDASVMQQYESQIAQLNSGIDATPTSAARGGNETGEIVITSRKFSEINALLADRNVALVKADVMMGSGPSVTVLDSQFDFLTDRHFVPNDPRQGGDLTITYNSFPFANLANGTIPTDPIADDAFNRWENDNNCANVGISQTDIVRVPNNGVFNSTLLTFGGTPGVPVSDVNIVGHLPGFILTDILDLDAGILGVAFSFAFLDGEGNLSDIDNDGFADTAFVEIMYNDDANWGLNVEGDFDTFDLAGVITHEQGHSLGLDHFGLLVRQNGSLKNIPEAVMNAVLISGNDNNALQSSDKAGFCANYSDWN